jgi:hypothetical protein
MYKHEVMRINFTTYDMRRAQDSININTPHAFIMALAHEDEGEDDWHPYLYAQVLGIFHVNIRLSDCTEAERVDFLWVHWFGRDLDHIGGFETRRYHRIGPLDPNSPSSYVFLDPRDVLRAVHLIPAFAICEPSPDSEADKNRTEWKYYYVSMYVNLLFGSYMLIEV